MKKKYEVFDPRTGETFYCVTREWVARLLAYFWKLDYARQGEGWIQNENVRIL